jgi:hypothetical protein
LLRMTAISDSSRTARSPGRPGTVLRPTAIRSSRRPTSSRVRRPRPSRPSTVR